MRVPCCSLDSLVFSLHSDNLCWRSSICQNKTTHDELSLTLMITTRIDRVKSITWQISHRGSLLERHWRRSLWCLLASLLAAWTSTSHFAHRAASSAQHITVAGDLSHTSHWIFILTNGDLYLFSHVIQGKPRWENSQKATEMSEIDPN